jgi:hypothetical protein
MRPSWLTRSDRLLETRFRREKPRANLLSLAIAPLAIGAVTAAVQGAPLAATRLWHVKTLLAPT